jgi:putative ABC transport system permease protein
MNRPSGAGYRSSSSPTAASCRSGPKSSASCTTCATTASAVNCAGRFTCLTRRAREHLSYAVKAKGDPAALAATLRRELRALDPDMAVNKMLPLSHYVSRSLASARFTALLAGLFAALALVLAAVGIYGLVSYSVAERTREIGVRMALGAGRRRILRLVLGQGMRPALVGIALGLVVAPALTRLIAGLLYGVTATDRLTFAVIAALLLAVAWLACWIPARRATKVDPLIALRCE